MGMSHDEERADGTGEEVIHYFALLNNGVRCI